MTLAPRLGELALFRGVGLESMESFVETSRRVTLKTSDVLLNPDVPNATLYAVLTGRLSVHLNSPGEPPFTHIETGACAGEMSIIEDMAPSAFVVAAEATELIAFTQTALWRMVNVSHRVARNLLVILAARLRFDNDYIVDSDELLRQYERNALTDALTDLNNRHWLEDVFARKIQRCRIDGGRLCLSMLDLDHFKKYNDSSGHLQGDRILSEVATSLRELFRPTDLIARYGGDEFAVLLPNSDLNTALAVTERVRGGVVERLNASGAGPITLSAGVAQLSANDDLAALIERADTALYLAKNGGRNCVAGDGVS